MKHTDFYSLHKKLDEQAKEELVAAVKAHGNEYVFIHFDEDGDYDFEELNNAPIVAASAKYMDGYEDFFISRIEVDEDGYYVLYGWPKDECPDEVEIDSVAHGHLEYVINCISETEEVKSVSIKHSAPILILSPEDVENVGYSSEMTVSQFSQIKRLMEKSFEWNMDVYWDALKQACDEIGIQPLNQIK